MKGMRKLLVVSIGFLFIASCEKERACVSIADADLMVEFTNQTGEYLEDFKVAGLTTDLKKNKTTCPIEMESLMLMGESVIESCSAIVNRQEVLGLAFCGTGAEIVLSGYFEVEIGLVEMNEMKHLTLELK